MNDGITGGIPDDIRRMLGYKLAYGEFSGTIPSMVKKAGLRLKTLVTSGSSDMDAINKLSGSVLGYNWEPKEDVLSVMLKFNISKK